jgi:1-pyrroline-5-carboxylate dehydrogenase
MDAVTAPPTPVNEPVLDYAPGSAERASLERALADLAGTVHDLPHTIGGARVQGKGARMDVRQPHAHRKVIGRLRNATKADAKAAVDAAMAAGPGWRDLEFDDRAAVLLKAADLLAGPFRATSGASTSTSPGSSSRSSRSPTPRASGTGSTTARSRGSSMPSRPSTSPRSPATSRRLPR